MILLSSCVLQLHGLQCAACEDLAASSMVHCRRQSVRLLTSCCPTLPHVADHQAMPAANVAQRQHTQHSAPNLHSGSCWQLCGGAGPAHCGHRRASILEICCGVGPQSQQTKPRPGETSALSFARDRHGSAAAHVQVSHSERRLPRIGIHMLLLIALGCCAADLGGNAAYQSHSPAVVCQC